MPGLGIGISISVGALGGPGVSGTILAKYHVDGDIAESGNGLTLESAFKTIAEAQAVLQAGESLWIQPKDDNSAYLEMLTLTGLDGCSVLSSGTLTPAYDGNGKLTDLTVTTQGAKIDCRDALANASFTKTGGQTNIYQIDVTFETANLATPMIKVWENGAVLTLATSLANCDATPGSYFVASHTVSPQTVYVHATGSGNVTSNGKTYQHNKRHTAINGAGVNNLTIRGLHMVGNLHADGSLRVGDGFTVSDCICEQGTKHNTLHGENGTYTRVKALNAYWNLTAATMFVYNKSVVSNGNVTYTDCLAISNDGRAGTNLSGFYGHINTSGAFGTIAHVNCTAQGLAIGFSGIQCAAKTYTNCHALNCTWGYNVDSTAPVTFTNSLVTMGSGGRGVLATIAGTTININGLTINHTAGSGFGIMLQNFANPIVTISGLVIDGVVGQTYGIYHTAAGGTVSVTGSDFTEIFEVYHTNAGSAAITSNNNRFRQATLDFTVQGVAYSTVALWQATGQDANSTIG